MSTYRVFGNFWDEPEHIAAGLALIDRGQYLYDDQHPPLARLAAAIGPYLAGARLRAAPDPSGVAEGQQVLYHSAASYRELLTLARLGMLPFLLVLLGSTWLWMRRWHGDAAALLCLVFLISTPVILGHAALVALDVPVTALIVASLYLLLRWFERPTLARGAALGVAAGLAAATKLSAVPFFGIAAAALMLLRLALRHAAPVRTPLRAPLRAQLRARLGSAALAAGLVLLIMVGMYGPHLLYLTTPALAPSRSLNFIAGDHGPLHELVYRFAARVRLPLGVKMVPLNFLGVEWHNAHGHPSFLLGRLGDRGWWYFYLVALSVKTPLPLLLLGLTGLTLLGVRGVRRADIYLLGPSVCFVSILAFCCLYSHINIGVRHVLIAYPLLAMGAACATLAAWHRWPGPAARVGVAALVLWQVTTLAVAYPDYVAYFNLLAGAHPERILVDSDLDWGGQDLWRLERVLAARHVARLAIGYRGTAELALEALPPYSVLEPGRAVTGWVAITMLTLQEDRAGYGWLLRYRPVQRVGQSFELYYVP
ncbi:MAG TPA: phospholipid carrier-dependent glycosyltransferase [Steroidobacteraceae bacterium]